MVVTNIKWDTDGNKEILESLPQEMEIPEGMYNLDEITDYLSDETGFCHDGFELIYEREDVLGYYKSLGISDEPTEDMINAILEKINGGSTPEEAADEFLPSIEIETIMR